MTFSRERTFPILRPFEYSYGTYTVTCLKKYI